MPEDQTQIGSNTSSWSSFPFAPRRWPFFYGWVIVCVTTLGVIASTPGQTIGVGVFTESLIDALKLSRRQLSLAYMFGTLVSGCLLPFAGSVTDRLGTRVVMALSSLGLGASLLLFANADHIGDLSPRPMVTIGLISGCFFFVRFFGQGCMTLVSRMTLSKWFNHYRGLATGISTVISAYAFNASPVFLNSVVELHGWKTAFYGLAVFTGTGVALMALIFYRDNPEQCGLAMDGPPGKRAQSKHLTLSRFEVHTQFTRAQAIRTPAFWTLSAIACWQGLFMTAFAFHLTSIGAAFGLTRTQAYSVFPAIGIVSALCAVFGGWISDRIRLKWLLLLSIAGQIIASVALLAFGNPVGRLGFILGYGLFAGLFGILLTVAWPRYFGREHLGAIAGFNQSLLVVSSALGPYLFSLLYDLNQTYTPVIWVCLIVPLAFILPTLTTKNPQLK